MNTSIPDFDKLGTLGNPEEPAGFGEDRQEEELNKAIEELRGVLHDEEAVEMSDLSGDDAGVVEVDGNRKMFVIVHNSKIKKGKEWERQRQNQLSLRTV